VYFLSADEAVVFSFEPSEADPLWMVRSQLPIVTPMVYWGLKSREATQLKDFDSKKVLEIKNNY